VANGNLYVASNSHLYAFYDAVQQKGVPDQPTQIKLNPAQ